MILADNINSLKLCSFFLSMNLKFRNCWKFPGDNKVWKKKLQNMQNIPFWQAIQLLIYEI